MKRMIAIGSAVIILLLGMVSCTSGKEEDFSVDTLKERIDENRPFKCVILTEGDSFWLITEKDDIEEVLEKLYSNIESVYHSKEGDTLSYLAGCVLSVIGETPKYRFSIYADFPYMSCGMACNIVDAETSAYLETLAYNTKAPIWDEIKQIAQKYLKRKQPIKDLDKLVKQQEHID